MSTIRLEYLFIAILVASSVIYFIKRNIDDEYQDEDYLN
jgi:hypothetical protein